MSKVKCVPVIMMILMICLMTMTVKAQTEPQVGIRAGVGTDVNGGLAYGAGVNYLMSFQQSSLELGIVYFGGSFKESSTEGIHTYDETTDIEVFGFLANYLIGYKPGEAGKFFIAGIGLASIGIEWQEQSTTDGSLDTKLPGGGSMQDAEVSGGGTVFNLGFGSVFKGGFDIRAEVPVIVSFETPGKAASVIPTFIITAGFRF